MNVLSVSVDEFKLERINLELGYVISILFFINTTMGLWETLSRTSTLQ